MTDIDRYVRRALRVFALLPVFFCACAVHAHVGGSTGLATIISAGQTVRYALTLPRNAVPGELADRMRLDQTGFEPDYEPLLAALRTQILISIDGRPCAPNMGTAQSNDSVTGDINLVVDYACAQAPGKLTVHDGLTSVLGTDYHTLANIRVANADTQFVFQSDLREVEIMADDSGVASGGRSFFLLGIEHILGGWDHLLFLLALLLPGRGFWQIAKIITAFTLGHSVTLALAVYDVVELPARLIEALIALSIAIVAAHSMIWRERGMAWQWVIALTFGLVHGFGFATVLRDLDLSGQETLRALFGFNVGVEAGQAIAIAASMPLLLWVGRQSWKARATRTMLSAVLITGLGLFVERAFL